MFFFCISSGTAIKVKLCNTLRCLFHLHCLWDGSKSCVKSLCCFFELHFFWDWNIPVEVA